MNFPRPAQSLSFLASTILGTIFLLAAFSKIGNLEAFHHALNDIKFLPQMLKGTAVLTLPGLELALGLCLLLRVSLKETAILSAGLLLAFVVFSIYAQLHGQTGGCGCFKIKTPGWLELSGWWLVTRNALFLALAGLILWRELPQRA